LSSELTPQSHNYLQTRVLTGSKCFAGRFKPGWRIRVGEYRVLYRIDDDRREVLVFEIGHRREVYR
jgi:mRNA interferase RelE/StbE